MDHHNFERTRLTRRGVLAAAGYAAATLMSGSLVGCGGSSSSGHSTSGGNGGTGSGGGTANAVLSVNRSEVNGTAFTARACWAGGADDCDIPADSSRLQVMVHADRAQAISLHDQEGRLAALAVSHGSASKGMQEIQFSAETSAAAIVFATPGILSCDPVEASGRIEAIKSLPSFSSLAASLRSAGGLAQGLDPQSSSLAGKCVEEYVAMGSKARGSAETLLLAEWLDGYTKIKVTHYAWRAVNVRCKCIDGGKARVGSVQPLSSALPGGVLMGGIPASWANLFHPGAPTEHEFPLSLTDFKGTTTAQLWVQGPGKGGGATALPSDVPSAASQEWISALFYIVLPLVDFFGGATRGLDAIKNADALLGALATTISLPEEEASLSKALHDGDFAATASALAGLVVGIVTGYIGPIADALGIGGIARAVLTKGLPLVAYALAVVNVSVAVSTWLALPDVSSVDVGVDYRHSLTKVDEGKGSPPFDWTHSSDIGDIPFGEYRAQVSVGYTNAPGTTKASKDCGGVPVYRVHVMQKMNNSVSVGQGAAVGVVRAILADGGAVERQLVAGVNTAEWAWDRDARLGTQPSHGLPDTDYPQRLDDSSVPGGSYSVKHFYVQLDLVGEDGPRRLQRLELEMFPSGLPSNFGLDIYGLTVDYAVA